MKLNIVIMVFAGLVLGGCKTKYVSVPEIHTEYITRVDTTVRKDSRVSERLGVRGTKRRYYVYKQDGVQRQISPHM